MSDIPPIDGVGPDKEPGVCAHGPCTCGRSEGLYCSEACSAADASDVEKDDAQSCPCGHTGCGGA